MLSFGSVLTVLIPKLKNSLTISYDSYPTNGLLVTLLTAVRNMFIWGNIRNKIILAIDFKGICHGQLITPYQACQMKCWEDKHMTYSNYDKAVAEDCQKYCLDHA